MVGGFQNTKLLGPRGLPSSSTSVTGPPTTSDESSFGLPMVALEQMKVGSLP